MGLPAGQRIRKPEEFRRVLTKGRKASDSLLTVAAVPHAGDGPCFGLSVSKRTGNAVERNRTKRRLREVLRRAGVDSPVSIVVTARPAASGATFQELRDSAARLLFRLGVASREGMDGQRGPDISRQDTAPGKTGALKGPGQ